MRSKCERCYYSRMVNVGANGQMMLACEYILHEYERRPCKPGAECTVYRPRRGWRRERQR
jgi:hypothetical protein